MRKLKEILRLRFEANLSYRHIAGSLHLSCGVVAKYAKLAAATGLTRPDLSALDETTLARLLGQAADVPARLSQYAAPDGARKIFRTAPHAPVNILGVNLA